MPCTQREVSTTLVFGSAPIRAVPTYQRLELCKCCKIGKRSAYRMVDSLRFSRDYLFEFFIRYYDISDAVTNFRNNSYPSQDRLPQAKKDSSSSCELFHPALTIAASSAMDPV